MEDSGIVESTEVQNAMKCRYCFKIIGGFNHNLKLKKHLSSGYSFWFYKHNFHSFFILISVKNCVHYHKKASQNT